MDRRFSLSAVVLVVAVVVSSCSASGSETDASDTTVAATGSDGAVASTVASDTEGGTDTTAAQETTTTTTVVQDAAILGADRIEQTTPTSGGGTRPLLEWAGVDGAALYFVNIYTETGGPYWSAVTAETSTFVGGPLPIPIGRTGPNVADGYTWVVYAEDADGNLIAASALRPIAP